LRGKGRGNERGVAGKWKGVEDAVAALGKRGKGEGIAVQRGDCFREERGAVGEDDPDVWGRVDKEREGKKKRLQGRWAAAGLAFPGRFAGRCLAGPRVGPVALFLFFVLISFSIFAANYFVLFEKEKIV
jgi:hypothetical protein